jgi:hypothetical protein
VVANRAPLAASIFVDHLVEQLAREFEVSVDPTDLFALNLRVVADFGTFAFLSDW